MVPWVFGGFFGGAENEMQQTTPWRSAGTPFCCSDASTAMSVEGMEGGAAAGMPLLASNDSDNDTSTSANGSSAPNPVQRKKRKKESVH